MDKIKLNFDYLPRSTGGIKWKDSIGCSIPFEYKDITGVFKIFDYKRDYTSQILIEFNGLRQWVKVDNLKLGSGNWEWLTQPINVSVKCESDIGQVINRRDSSYVIVGQYSKNINGSTETVYICECLNCKTVFHIQKSMLMNGCPVCSKYMEVIIGINDIPTTDPWMISYFPNGIKQAQNYTANSKESFYPICPQCGNLSHKKVSPYYIKKYHSCRCPCEVHITIPELIMYNYLEYNHIPFVWQATKHDLQWIGDYRYDFLIPENKLIIETHGLQHYEEVDFLDESIAEIQENDQNKEQLCIENGYKYLAIDCRYSEIKWIINSINESNLNNILGTQMICPDDEILLQRQKIKNHIKNNAPPFTQVPEEYFKESKSKKPIALYYDTNLIGVYDSHYKMKKALKELTGSTIGHENNYLRYNWVFKDHYYLRVPTQEQINQYNHQEKEKKDDT